jgi:hypothetical protein
LRTDDEQRFHNPVREGLPTIGELRHHGLNWNAEYNHFDDLRIIRNHGSVRLTASPYPPVDIVRRVDQDFRSDQAYFRSI